MSDQRARDDLRRLLRPRAPGPSRASLRSSEPEVERESECQAARPAPGEQEADAETKSIANPASDGVDARAGIAARLARRAGLRRPVRESAPRSARGLERADGLAAQPAREPDGTLSREVFQNVSREFSREDPRELVRGTGGALARVRDFEGAHAHGTSALEAFLSIDRAGLARCARDERLQDVDLSRAVFLDTETTGLSGGSGTYVFLVGLGRFVAGRFEVWQGFLPHPAEERALLEETAGRIAEASVILSFFGKSFDRHRLEDKMRVHGVAPPFASRIHLDLYYPLRRAHRGRFENCRLKTLERELGGVRRPDDLPGSFAPAAWFDYQARRPHQLEGVFRHNQDDVLSLVTLAAHLGASDARA